MSAFQFFRVSAFWCATSWDALALVGWLCLVGFPGIAGAAEALTIATYNVENYGLANRMTEDGYREDYPKPEKQKDALRRTIRALQADILAVQEMGPRAYLEELQADLAREGSAYPHLALGEAADRERHVALLSKLPLSGVRTHADLAFKYFGGVETVKRGVLEATVTTPAGSVTLFVVHLKSRYTDRPDDPMSTVRRASEATAVRDLVLRRFPDPAAARFIVLGDCNDTRMSKTLVHLQRRGKLTVMSPLPANDSRGETWTHCYRREDTYSRVDYILLSPGLRVAVREPGARIFDADFVRQASDHRPVVVTLQWGGK